MALRGTLQKATFEAAYFERQALSAQRFLAFDNVLGESQDMHASPPDTLTERLAEVSQEPVGSPLRSDPSPRHHVCEIDTFRVAAHSATAAKWGQQSLIYRRW